MIHSPGEELRCRLLNQSLIKGAPLTEEGTFLPPYAGAALEAIETLRQKAEHTAYARKRALLIGIYPGLTQNWLSAIIREF